MSVTPELSFKYVGSDGRIVEVPIVLDGNEESLIERDIPVPAVSTNLEVLLNIDVTQLLFLLMWSTADDGSKGGNMTVYTNDVGGGAPNDTLFLVEGDPLVYVVGADSRMTNPLGTDVTKIYIDEDNSKDSTLHIIAIQDATP